MKRWDAYSAVLLFLWKSCGFTLHSIRPQDKLFVIIRRILGLTEDQTVAIVVPKRLYHHEQWNKKQEAVTCMLSINAGLRVGELNPSACREVVSVFINNSDLACLLDSSKLPNNLMSFFIGDRATNMPSNP